MYPLTIGLVVSTPSLWEEAQAELQQLPVRIVLEVSSIDDPITFIEKVNRSQPDVVLIDPGHISDGLSEIIRQVRGASSNPHVVVVRDQANPQDILSALRSGASEYVYPPVGKNLREALERISQDRHDAVSASGPRGGKVIGFLSVKGGCGATTLACHAAMDIARMTSKETLLADFDFASGMIRSLMQARSRYSVLDALSNMQRLDSNYWRGLISNGYQGVEILAGTPPDVIRQMPAGSDIRHILRFVRNQYAWSVVDLGHGIEPHTLSALEEVDSLVLVSTMEVPSLQQSKTMFKYLKEIGLSRNKIHFVLNRIPRRGEISPADVEGVLSEPIFAVIPNDYKALEQVYSNGRMLPDDHTLRHSIARLSSMLTGVQAEEKKKKFSLFGLSV